MSRKPASKPKPTPQRRYPKVAGHAALSLAGRAPDAVVAAIVGCSPDGIRYQRGQLGLERPDVEAWRADRDAQDAALSLAVVAAEGDPERAADLWRTLDRYMPVPQRLLVSS